VMDGGVEKVFVCGGNGGGWLNNCRLYDPVSNTWSAMPNMLSIRGRTSGTGFNNCIYMPGGTNGASTQATSETTCLTPVLAHNLLYFDLYKEQSTVKLTWAFPEEASPASADVQRSLNGIEFETIGKSEVVASPEMPYLFSDLEVNDIARETVHYRLQIGNQDGSFSFSEILAVDMRNAGFTATGHPNPVQDQFTCEIMAHGDHSVQFRITDILGREMMANTFMTVEGHNAYNLDLGELSRGTYFMFLSAPSGHKILQFVKE
jgi:Secretion system C-terminal sorting domain/Kelch motif